MTKIKLALLFLLPLFTACATSQDTACQGSDWYELGRRDGARGIPDEQITDRLSHCEGDIKATAEKLYQNGYNAGLVEYCSPGNAFYLGSSNQKYYYVCPPSLEEGFVKQYEKGQQAYYLQQANEEIDQQIDSLFRELSEQSLSTAQRKLIQSELSELKKTKERNERQLARIQN